MSDDKLKVENRKLKIENATLRKKVKKLETYERRVARPNLFPATTAANREAARRKLPKDA